MKLQVRKVGNSLGFILPKKLMETFHIREGDELHVISNENAITLTPYDPAFDKVMAAYEEFAHQYKNALKELADK